MSKDIIIKDDEYAKLCKNIEAYSKILSQSLANFNNVLLAITEKSINDNKIKESLLEIYANVSATNIVINTKLAELMKKYTEFIETIDEVDKFLY